MSVNSKKRSRGKKVALIGSTVTLGLVLVVFSIVYIVFMYYYGMLDYQALKEDYEIVSSIDADDDLVDGENSSDEEIASLEAYLAGNLTWDDFDASILDNENVRHILLVGIDTRLNGTSGSRSDSMIIVSINSETKQIVMTSLLRDTYVYIPEVGYGKLNAAHAYGGIELLIDTIEANYKIHIDEYAKVNFYSFMRVIDLMGGVSLNVTSAEIEVMQGYIREINKLQGNDEDAGMLYPEDAGYITLSGKQALAYCRVRYVGTDFGRTERQRKVLEQMFEKAKNMSVANLNKSANLILPYITTNLTQADVLELLVGSADYLSYDLYSCSLPISGSYQSLTIDYQSVLSIDFQENFNYWYSAVYEGALADEDE